jgi:anti-anti-sigma factor
MPLTIRSRVENEIAILDLEGALTLGPGLQALREAARKQLTEHRLRGMVLNAADLTVADSAGLGELTIIYTLASRQQCPLVIAGARPNLMTTLEITHLDGLLPTLSDVPAALASLRPERREGVGGGAR